MLPKRPSAVAFNNANSSSSSSGTELCLAACCYAAQPESRSSLPAPAATLSSLLLPVATTTTTTVMVAIVRFQCCMQSATVANKKKLASQKMCRPTFKNKTTSLEEEMEEVQETGKRGRNRAIFCFTLVQPVVAALLYSHHPSFWLHCVMCVVLCLVQGFPISGAFS